MSDNTELLFCIWMGITGVWFALNIRPWRNPHE